VRKAREKIADHCEWDDLSRDERVLALLRVTPKMGEREMTPTGYERMVNVTADDLARRLGVTPARRAGSGATKGSWSGHMSPGLRVVPMLRAMERAGLIFAMGDHREKRYRSIYYRTAAGDARLAAADGC
jgi:hypothetical protein